MTVTAEYIQSLIDERPKEGVYRLDRRLFTDEELFELEMEHIFEGNWIYLAHEAQIPNPGDYLSLYMGRQPVLLIRGHDGVVRAFRNECTHRGAKLTEMSRGNCRKVLACPFHGWCFRTDGTLADWGSRGGKEGYGDGFRPEELGLRAIGRLESYRGFLFGSLNPDVLPLAQHLGPAAAMIDLLVDEHPDGRLEVLPGVQTYTYRGNWKLQAENGVDGYHVFTLHANYVETTQRRRKLLAEKDPVKAVDVAGIDALPGGFFDLGHGHVMLWSQWPNPEVRPLYRQYEALKQRVGETRAWWMVEMLRNLLLYPNVFLMDQTSTQIRQFRPISVDETEVTTVCIAPADEDPEARDRRIRQYEDFFNASGMATPDDLAAFESVQEASRGSGPHWADMSRGARHIVRGANEFAKQLGIEPAYSGSFIEDEGIFLGQHRYWREVMLRALRGPEGVRRVA